MDSVSSKELGPIHLKRSLNENRKGRKKRSMITKTLICPSGKVQCEYYGDDQTPRYALRGLRFDHMMELLKLISQYGGSCTDDPKRYATAHPCAFNCIDCERSIYHVIGVKERFFNKKCEDLCFKTPKVGDEWEISIVNRLDQTKYPRYESYYFKAKETDDSNTIVGIIFNTIMEFRRDIDDTAKYCFVKIKRADMTEPFDVSTIADVWLKKELDKLVNKAI